MTCNAFETNESLLGRLSLNAYDTLNELRTNKQLCDSAIKVEDGVEFPVHRAILSGIKLSIKLKNLIDQYFQQKSC